MKNIKAFWYKAENNFGDVLTPYLIKCISGAETEFCDAESDEDKVVTAGSILNNDIKNAIFWGTGIANSTDNITRQFKNILAVRGPISAQMVKDQVGLNIEILGDPGILVRRFYNKPIPDHKERKYIGVIPHYVDYQKTLNINLDAEKFIVIDITAGIEQFMDKIVLCKKIFSSSLHGIIAAQSLETPAQWIKLSDSVLGDDIKFYDYLLSVGVSKEEIRFLDFRNSTDKTIINILENSEVQYIGIPDEMINRLMSVCPFKDK